MSESRKSPEGQESNYHIFPKMEAVAGDRLKNYKKKEIQELRARYNDIMKRATLRQMMNYAGKYGKLVREKNEAGEEKVVSMSINPNEPDLERVVETAKESIEGQAREAIDQAITEHQLRESSNTDDLTGLYRREAFLFRCEQIRAEMDSANEAGYIVFFDLDNFKAVNELSHEMGDVLLKKIAETIRKNLRGSNDMTCRYGGDELAVFVKIKRNDTKIKIEHIVERLYKEIATIPTISIGEKSENWKRSVSVGVAEMETSDSVKETINQADIATQTAKNFKTPNSGGITFLEKGNKAKYIKAVNEGDDILFSQKEDVEASTERSLEQKTIDYVDRAFSGNLPCGKSVPEEIKTLVTKLLNDECKN